MRHATRHHTRHQHARRLAGLIALGLMLAAGCAEDDPRIEKCGATDIIRHGEYVLVNDNEEHPGYAQCIFDDPEEGTLGWTWEARSSDPTETETGTSAYIFYGLPGRWQAPSLWNMESTTSALPISTDDLAALTIKYDVHVSTTSRYRLGVSTNNLFCHVGSCGGTVLSIWLDYSHPPVAAHFQKQITINDEKYDFYLNTSSPAFDYYWFVKVRPSQNGMLDFCAFLKYLDEEGYGKVFPEIDFLNFFQDIVDGGSGSTTFHTYSINVTPRTQ